jgi:hypothetical protein
MATLIAALKRPFDAGSFPHLTDFLVSGYKPPETGRSTEVKLLHKPASHTALMKVERDIVVHLDEVNLGREITAMRHSTRDQAPELILTSIESTPAATAFLAALVAALPRASHQEIEDAIFRAKNSGGHGTAVHAEDHAKFTQVSIPKKVLSPRDLQLAALLSLCDVMKAGKFASGTDVNLVQRGTAIEAKFPRTVSSLWLGSSFKEAIHMKEVANFVTGVRTDPVLREGWFAIYEFDSKAGLLHIRALEAGLEPPSGWKRISA